MKTIITKEYISKKVNKFINEIVKENIENENNILSNLYSKNIYYYFESVDKYFSFWETTILIIAKSKIDKIENWIFKNNLDSEKDKDKIIKYIQRFYK